jgi:hypothetical protein
MAAAACFGVRKGEMSNLLTGRDGRDRPDEDRKGALLVLAVRHHHG